MTLQPFTCSHCGNCCKDISKKNIHLPLPAPMVNADSSAVEYPVHDRGLMINAFERKDIINLAKKHAIKTRFLPLLGYFSKKFRAIFTVTYILACIDCPFYIADKCIIYGQRPLTCRSYPIILNPQGVRPPVSGDKRCPNSTVFSYIPNYQDSHIKLPNYYKLVYALLKDNYVAALKMYYFTELVQKELARIERRKVIIWENFTRTYQKQYKKFQIVDLFSYLLKHDYYSEKKFQKIKDKFHSMKINDLFKALGLKLSVPSLKEIRKKGLENLLPTGDHPDTP
ncbi:MAG: YkgJ family cysteine cluster protein [Promethearchaeota archaeon]